MLCKSHSPKIILIRRPLNIQASVSTKKNRPIYARNRTSALGRKEAIFSLGRLARRRLVETVETQLFILVDKV
jgi:hypothetical protein